MCRYMGMEATPNNREVLKTLGNGQCLFQDLDGHVGILKFDAVFQDIIDVFSTTPKTKADEKIELKETEAAEMPEAAGDIPSAGREALPSDPDFNFDDEELYRKEDILCL